MKIRPHIDLVVLSPGIDPASPLARNFFARKIEIIGELELGWRSCEMPVIAVTGTNGKTTTTELLAQMLNACGQRTIACGNIGKPLSEVAREKQRFDVLTVEVSSFQLETIRTFHPSVSLWLNFAPDHLDRYRSVSEYRAAKLRIFENQTEDDVAVVNASEKTARRFARVRSPLALTPIGRLSPVRRCDRLSRRTGAATGGRQTARLAQHREPDGDARRRHGARIVVRANGAAALRLRAASASLRICPRSRRRRLHQRFEGDKPRCGGESAARAKQAGRPDRRRKRQGIHL